MAPFSGGSRALGVLARLGIPGAVPTEVEYPAKSMPRTTTDLLLTHAKPLHAHRSIRIANGHGQPAPRRLRGGRPGDSRQVLREAGRRHPRRGEAHAPLPGAGRQPQPAVHRRGGHAEHHPCRAVGPQRQRQARRDGLHGLRRHRQVRRAARGLRRQGRRQGTLHEGPHHAHGRLRRPRQGRRAVARDEARRREQLQAVPPRDPRVEGHLRGGQVLLHRRLLPHRFGRLAQGRRRARALRGQAVLPQPLGPFIVDFFGDQVATALEYADYLFCNESEAAAYGKKHGLGDDGKDLKEVALQVAASPKKGGKPRTVVFTQGSSATIVACNGTVTEYPVTLLPKEALVDTNGAGDSFVGGFLAAMLVGKDVKDCVEAGHFAARFIIQQSGCTLDKPCELKL
ncbi:hypothetical protein THAOC_00853 [Thalassiosira oceanica]|uniref:Adenosine kinase n=1 Tax=Thalassiosira oceanica TaxID=159749 RepID=K0TIC6_THAOC|nr:hypothetical protein THAOC_00853 [Thalassiosira oceanica]|eukprot:EJK77320.1 hypothetical protein THAOC_00853 [Thalassiosira oceanica]